MTRLLVITAMLAAVAIVLQTSVLAPLAINQMVPSLVVLLVVAVGLSRDAFTGMAAGFMVGLMVDLAPPADHLAGRWALALLLVGFIAGRVRDSAYQVRPLLAVLTVAIGSLVATTTFVLTGVLTAEPVALTLPQMLTGVGLDMVAAPLVLPWLIRLFAIAQPRQLVIG